MLGSSIELMHMHGAYNRLVCLRSELTHVRRANETNAAHDNGRLYGREAMENFERHKTIGE